jgi:hypothetical protein
MVAPRRLTARVWSARSQPLAGNYGDLTMESASHSPIVKVAADCDAHPAWGRLGDLLGA